MRVAIGQDDVENDERDALYVAESLWRRRRTTAGRGCSGSPRRCLRRTRPTTPTTDHVVRVLRVVCFVVYLHVAVSFPQWSSTSSSVRLVVDASFLGNPGRSVSLHHPAGRHASWRLDHEGERGPRLFTTVLLQQQQQQQRRHRNNRKGIIGGNAGSSRTTTATATTTATTATATTTTTTPQHIPQTQTIPQSFASFVKYCVQQQTAFFATRKRRRHQKQLEHKQQQQQRRDTTTTTFSCSSSTTTPNDVDGLLLPPPPPPKSAEDNDDHDHDSTARHRGFFATIRHWNRQRQALVELANYKSHIVLPSFTALTIGALLVSVIPHYEAKCIQLVATLHPHRIDVVQAISGLLVTSTLAAVFTGLRGSLFWMAGSRANYQIRVQLHANLLYQETAFFDEYETGNLLSRLNSDVNKIGQVISYHVNVVCRQLAQFIFGSLYLIRISPPLSLVAGLGIVSVALCSAIYGRFNRDCAVMVQDTFANATSVAETSFRLSETIRLLNGRQTQSACYEQAQREALRLEEIQAWGYGVHKMVSDTLQSFLHGALLFLCWWYGRYTIGLPAERLTTFLFYTHFVLESSNEVGDQWAKIQGAVGASQSVFGLLRRIPTLQDYYETTTTAATPTVVELRNEELNEEDHDEIVAVNDTNDVVANVKNVATSQSSTTTTSVWTTRQSHVTAIPKINGIGSEPIATPVMVETVPAAAATVATTATIPTTLPSDAVTLNVRKSMPHANGAVAVDPLLPTSNGVVVVNGGTTTASSTTTTAAAVLSLSNVTLQYQAMDRPALTDVTVDFFPGDRVAIVGRSGSGKSSLLRTLLRLYDPTVGRVSYRGTALTDLSRRQLSSVLTMVPQEPALFPLSLLDNVLYGIDKDDAVNNAYSPHWQARARMALEQAGLDVVEIPLDARIGDGGRVLSGGQKQRVAIARALVRQDSSASAAETILILDEPTAALDSATEQQVIGTLRDLMDAQADLCVIMVTHRLNIIQALGVNRVLVMDQGRIVESGRPADLLANSKGIYSRLAVEQGILSSDKPEQQKQQQHQEQPQQTNVNV